MTSTVQIDTARLTMRPHRREDFEESKVLWADPIVVRHITGKPSTEEEVWARLMRYLGHWQLLGFGYWVVREKASGRFVGEVGFADFKREVDPPFNGAPESGWVLAPWAHGKGFATEALTAALAWGDGRGWQRTVCMINPANEASIRVARKAGYRQYAETKYKTDAVLLFERLPSL